MSIRLQLDRASFSLGYTIRMSFIPTLALRSLTLRMVTPAYALQGMLYRLLSSFSSEYVQQEGRLSECILIQSIATSNLVILPSLIYVSNVRWVLLSSIDHSEEILNNYPCKRPEFEGHACPSENECAREGDSDWRPAT